MVGMKKEWILSEDQLRRRKNARIKNQMGKDGNQQPNTPSSVGEGSMPGSVAPVTPYVGNGNGGLNPFSPPQQQVIFSIIIFINFCFLSVFPSYSTTTTNSTPSTIFNKCRCCNGSS